MNSTLPPPPAPPTIPCPAPCPICAGETDPFAIELRSLCEEHFAGLPVMSEEQFQAALEEGRKAYEACLDGTPMMPGYYR